MKNQEKSKGIIYKAINLKTNEVYIGATTNSIDERIKDHTIKANNGNGHKFHEAIATYGIDSFRWKQIDTASNIDELATLEINYIQQNDSVDNGYNADKGGGFKKTIYKYNLDGTLNDKFKDLKSAAYSVDATKKAISKACWSVNHTLGGFLWSYEYVEPFKPQPDSRKKEVLQYNINGNLLVQYISVAEANRKTGISKSSIAKCCRGERKHGGGFIWKYS